MGKLLTGHFGVPPEAESVPLSLMECNQKLGLKPSDFVSVGAPKFFEKDFGAPGRYLVFLVEESETKDSPIWKPGYYLLPLEAAEVLKALARNRRAASGADPLVLPVQWEAEEMPPPGVKARLDHWVSKCQPLFFTCGCDHLELKLDKPWGLRRKWRARLRCPRKCQPPLTTLL